MSTDTVLLVAVVVVALGFGLLNGFHDGCNAVSTAIYTKALKPRTAIGLSAFFNFIAPLVTGVAVAKTIGEVIKAGDASFQLVIAAMLGASIWAILTWIWALPVSSSHALVGGLLGAGLAALGTDGIDWAKVILVFAALFLSPFVGIFTGYAFMHISRFFFARRRMTLAGADRFYRYAQIVSSSWVSFSHGSNDATKVMGIIVIFLAARQRLDVTEYVAREGVPLWVILSAAAAMAIGTYLSVRSFRLIKTVGEKITELHPINGFSAQVGGAIVIQIASLFGLPVSTTHVITSAVAGTGLASKLGGGKLEGLPCYHAGLGGHPAVLCGRGRCSLLSPRPRDVGGQHGRLSARQDQTHARRRDHARGCDRRHGQRA